MEELLPIVGPTIARGGDLVPIPIPTSTLWQFKFNIKLSDIFSTSGHLLTNYNEHTYLV